MTQPAQTPANSAKAPSLVPTIVSAVIGVALGAAAIAGIVAVGSSNTLPAANAVSADNALLGGVEYGSR